MGVPLDTQGPIVLKNVLSGLLDHNAIVPVEMVARIRCAIPSQEIVRWVVSMGGLVTRATKNVLLGLLDRNAIVPVEMVARISCAIPSQESVPWGVSMGGSVTLATKCVVKAILERDAW